MNATGILDNKVTIIVYHGGSGVLGRTEYTNCPDTWIDYFGKLSFTASTGEKVMTTAPWTIIRPAPPEPIVEAVAAPSRTETESV